MKKYLKNILKNTTNISNITKYVENPNPNLPNLACSVFDYLLIYNLLIITIPDLEFLALPNPALLIV